MKVRLFTFHNLMASLSLEPWPSKAYKPCHNQYHIIYRSTLKYLSLIQVALLSPRLTYPNVCSTISHLRYNEHLKFNMSKMKSLSFPKPAFLGAPAPILIILPGLKTSESYSHSGLQPFTHLSCEEVIWSLPTKRIDLFSTMTFGACHQDYFSNFLTGYSASTFVIK